MVFVAACLAAADMRAATINVPADVRTIQSAINAAATGDTILVAPGTYTETIVVNKDLTLRSSDGAAVTVLRVGSADKIVLTVSAGRTAATLIEGFTITGASLATGGALTIQDASPIISRNVIRNNTTGQGGAALRATSSDGAHAPTIVNNIIYANTSTASGGAVAVNNVGALLFAGNTVCGNSAATTGGGFDVEAGSADIRIVDCIFWANGASNLAGVTAAMISYCDVEGGAPEGGTGNIAADPRLVNAAGGDFHLLAASPCRGAGTAVAALAVDFDGEPRDATPDIGADEYRVPPVTGLACTPDVLDVLLAWTNPWTGYTSIEVFRDGDPTAIATLAGTATAYTDSSVLPGDHSYAVVAYAGADASSPATCASVHVEVPPVTGLACTRNGDVADLAWTNGYAYTNVRILREGAEAALLPGSATSYRSTTLAVGPNNFQVIGVLDGASSDAAACTVEMPLAPPYDLTCTAGTASLTVTLQWTNGDAYDSVEIHRNGTIVQTLTGAPTSFIDTLTAPGEYAYSVLGKVGTYASAAAACTATLTYVPPATNLLCPIGTDGIAHLTWTNGASNYTGIAVTIDGVPAPGTPLTG
ncbi:MAG TPA: hypothetical protein DCM87_11905, partial [Planctomycetes bacterium]|nr:hypothetical protein [Planctomycetota bacterium]